MYRNTKTFGSRAIVIAKARYLVVIEQATGTSAIEAVVFARSRAVIASRDNPFIDNNDRTN
jgi:hypothetical protein